MVPGGTLNQMPNSGGFVGANQDTMFIGRIKMADLVPNGLILKQGTTSKIIATVNDDLTNITFQRINWWGYTGSLC